MLLTVPNSLHFHSLVYFPFSSTWSIFDLEDYTWDYLEQKYQVKREYKFNSVQFSCSVMSDSLQPCGLQHTRPPCPSPTPRAYSNSCPLNCDAIQPSHPLSSPSPPAFNLSQHQGLFKWVSSSHQVAKVLELQIQHQSFQWTFRTDFF